MIRRLLASLRRWRLHTPTIWVLGWLTAIVLLIGVAAMGVRSVLPIASPVAAENAFLAIMLLGLAVLAANIRWVPPLERRARWLIYFFGVSCSAASLCFGIKGLALICLVSAMIDLGLARISGTESPP